MPNVAVNSQQSRVDSNRVEARSVTPAVDGRLEAAELKVQVVMNRRRCGHDSREARAQDAVVHAGEEQRRALPLAKQHLDALGRQLVADLLGEGGLGRDLEYLPEPQHKPLAAEVSEIARMLHGLRIKVDPGE